MKVTFAPSFFDSLERLVQRERWYWKAWDFVRYDFPRGVKNMVFFFRQVWNYRGWDHHGSLVLFRRSLEPLHGYILNGHEIDETRLKKARVIARTIDLLRHIEADDYTGLAEAELGYRLELSGWNEERDPVKKERNSKIFARAREIEESMWKELWQNLEGQDTSLFPRGDEEDIRDSDQRWYAWFDGTGLRGWWD
jgi:hypothetical protein